jgi:hypothetical protein
MIFGPFGPLADDIVVEARGIRRNIARANAKRLI